MTYLCKYLVVLKFSIDFIFIETNEILNMTTEELKLCHYKDH